MRLGGLIFTADTARQLEPLCDRLDRYGLSTIPAPRGLAQMDDDQCAAYGEQARKLGLYAHAMAGFSQDKAYEILGVSRDDYHIMAAIAVGRKDESADDLPEDILAMEAPNTRKSWADVATHRFPINEH